jgi:hypothetical protein
MNDRFVLQGDLTILDQETGLLWQRAASADRMVWKDGFTYVDELNESEFAGHGDWRYPSKDEMKTLILPQENRSSGLYISSLFGNQRNCWTSSHGEHHRAVYADFYYGDIYWVEENYANYFIRAVRSK